MLLLLLFLLLLFLLLLFLLLPPGRAMRETARRTRPRPAEDAQPRSGSGRRDTTA